MKTIRKPQRGGIYFANLDPAQGCEQGGMRPVLVLQNDVGNRYSPTLIVAAITGKIYSKAILPTHVLIEEDVGLRMDSIVLLEQIRTIDKGRLIYYVGTLSHAQMDIINAKLAISLGIKCSS